MRPIKFRYFDEVKKQMTYSNELTSLEGFFCHYESGNNILMQFTGLHDSTGKEIYEGDILHIEHFIFYVCYAHGAFIVKENKESDTYFSLSNINKFSLIMANIHENPELLETK